VTLEELRARINRLDEELVRLLNERIRVAMEIGRSKQEAGEEVFGPGREKEVLGRVSQLNPGPLTTESLQSIYREIMSAARAHESPLKIAYLGPPATFTHQAARMKFGASVTYVACETIGDVFAAVEKRAADYGVVPIENSTDGAVTHTLDEFMQSPLKICAEIYLPVSQSLLSTGRKEDIRRIYSKFEVFGQCRRWLTQHMTGVELLPASSTAKAAEMAAKEPGAAALASALAAELYGLAVLEPDVQDYGGNTTRFLVIGHRWGRPSGADKTSILFTVKHKVGALHDALQSFKEAGVNMSKIESRPSKRKAWEYCFFVDLEAHADEPRLQAAMTALSEHTLFLIVLGAYPRAVEAEAKA
jgi:chorismate mutase/prephenate dehydratase